jgi:hypothetical protein
MSSRAVQETISTLHTTLDGQRGASILLETAEPYGGLKNLPISLLICSQLVRNSVMRRIHPITWLRGIVEVLFEKKYIFGAATTAIVLEEMHKRFVAAKHHRILAPWKILCVIDLSIDGYWNYNGAECEYTGVIP